MNLVIILVLMLTILVLYGEIRKWIIKRKLGSFESPKQIPILGVAGRFIGKSNDQIIDIVLKIIKEAKSTPVHAWFGPILAIGICEPEDVQIILSSDGCLNRPYFYDHFHYKLSIIATDKEIWKPHRCALNSAFNMKALQSYIPHLNDKSRILLKQMEPFLEERGDLYRTIFICMMDMIARTTMGSELNLQIKERGESLYRTVKIIMNSVQYRVVRFWLRSDFIYNWSKVGRDEKLPLQTGNSLIEEMYNNKVDELNLLKSQGIDFLEQVKSENSANFLEKCLILERDGVFNHETVLDQLSAIALGGFDTSTSTAFSTLLMLAMNQKHQGTVLEELRSVFETADCDVTQTHLAGMPYMERVIRETMRLLPPTPLIARQSSADIKLPRGTVPKDAFVVINIMQLHRNPRIWGENVTEFDPDRFLPENIAKRPPFSYIPFSGGVRNCIATKYAMISAKITLAHLLRRFKFTTDLKFEDIRVKTHLILEVTNVNPLQIEERNF
ncbi:probable cytochrome P450 313a4 [Sitodiplosis mosellana]|uniref:probable cytochrome P450 313a4 n=1 Tax=Sitodiplosis mosellana TaxID=263140 RepID=UPI0024446DE2|nr:probable cytochrome P450 313a4 [Sitodiplosis mosellana]